MGELRAARAFANRPDVGRARLEPIVDRDIATGVKRDTGEIEPDPGGIGGASGCDQYVAAFDSLFARGHLQPEADGLPGAALHT